MSKDPLVSIITVTRNRVEFLERTILSVKNQDYPNIEHIIIDGGSTDGTLDIIKKHEGSYNLRWISEKDESAAQAFNKGFAMSKGQIICGMDSDDVYLPGTISKIVSFFKQHPAINFVFGDNYLIDRNDRIVGMTRRTNFNLDVMIYIGMNITPQAAFWRRELHEKVRGMDESFKRCPDREFFLRMALAGAKFYHLRDFLVSYRLHSGQTSIDNRKLFDAENEKIFATYAPHQSSPLRLRLKRSAVLLKKAFVHLGQGDALYLFQRLLERLHVLPDYDTKAQQPQQ